LPSIWIPFSRPAGKSTITHENVGTMKTTMKGEIKGKTTAPDVWLPEEGIGFKGKEMEGRGKEGESMESGEGRVRNEEIGTESPEGVEEITTEKSEGTTNEKEEWTLGIGSTTEEQKEEEFTSTISSSTLTRHSEEATSTQFTAPQTTPPFGQTQQNGPLTEMSLWSLPAVSPTLLSSISANLSATTFNCTERMSKMASQLYSSPSSTRCQCPKGKMPQIDGQCHLASVSTFRTRIESLCGLRLRQPSQEEEQLTHMKVALGELFILFIILS